MAGYTQVWTPLDFEADGKQYDWLRLPFSTDLSGYGVVPIPVICLRNGDGPTALLIAGSHGDEYEGQVALAKLSREIEAADVRGRIIILPSLNLPAVEAGRRVSPLDDGNLNRSFPGNPIGAPTVMIAHYVGTVDPPPLNWSTLNYVFWQTGGPQCRRSVTSPKRLSRSCARSMCWSRRVNPLPMRSARSA